MNFFFPVKSFFSSVYLPRSGTSQSCGLAAGAAALVREYLSDWAERSEARLSDVWASSIKALLVASAKLDRNQGRP